MLTEKQIENKIKHLLATKGAYYFKHFGCKFSRAGVPDIVGVLNGRFLGIEVKREDGKTTELQEYHLEKIRKSGGIGIVVRPSNFEELKKILEEVQNEKTRTT